MLEVVLWPPHTHTFKTTYMCVYMWALACDPLPGSHLCLPPPGTFYLAFVDQFETMSLESITCPSSTAYGVRSCYAPKRTPLAFENITETSSPLLTLHPEADDKTSILERVSLSLQERYILISEEKGNSTRV